MLDGPSPSVGRDDHTYELASSADVTMLLKPSSTTWSPSRRAVPTGAQKWLRVPISDQASVVTCRPAAMAWRTSGAPYFSINAVPA